MKSIEIVFSYFSQSYLSEWRIIFWITFALLFITTIFYDVFASGKVEWWNDPLNANMNGRTMRSGEHSIDEKVNELAVKSIQSPM